MNNTSHRNELVAFGRLLFDRGLVSGTGGNMSVKMEKGILITPTGSSLGLMKADDLVVINKQGEKIEGQNKPSSEKLMHLMVYEKRSDIGACCHAHPPYATAFSLTDRKLRVDIHPEAILTLGEIAHIEYAPPGTEAVPKAIAKLVKAHDVFILKNHGVLTLGRDLREAFYRMETVEHLAKVTYISKRTGKLDYLEKGEIERLRKIRHDYIGDSDK